MAMAVAAMRRSLLFPGSISAGRSLLFPGSISAADTMRRSLLFPRSISAADLLPIQGRSDFSTASNETPTPRFILNVDGSVKDPLDFKKNQFLKLLPKEELEELRASGDLSKDAAIGVILRDNKGVVIFTYRCVFRNTHMTSEDAEKLALMMGVQIVSILKYVLGTEEDYTNVRMCTDNDNLYKLVANNNLQNEEEVHKAFAGPEIEEFKKEEFIESVEAAINEFSEFQITKVSREHNGRPIDWLQQPTKTRQRRE